MYLSGERLFNAYVEERGRGVFFPHPREEKSFIPSGLTPRPTPRQGGGVVFFFVLCWGGVLVFCFFGGGGGFSYFGTETERGLLSSYRKGVIPRTPRKEEENSKEKLFLARRGGEENSSFKESAVAVRGEKGRRNAGSSL